MFSFVSEVTRRDHFRLIGTRCAAATPPEQAVRNLWTSCQPRCGGRPLGEHFFRGRRVRGRTMGTHEASYDYTRYRKLLAEAVDEKRRLELIDLMIKEKARDRLQEELMSDRVAMTTATVARILGPDREAV